MTTKANERLHEVLGRLKWHVLENERGVLLFPDPQDPVGGGLMGLKVNAVGPDVAAQFLVEQHNLAIERVISEVIDALQAVLEAEPLTPDREWLLRQVEAERLAASPAETPPAPQLDAEGIDWSLPRRTASELPECPDCGEPWCPECKKHFAECAHPGPQSERPH